MLHVKTGDNVLVITGKEKNKTGRILSVNKKDNTVVVENLNMITKHRKPRSQQDKGGIEKIAGKMSSSNVQIICAACKKATRVSNRLNENGTKERICKKCGASLDVKYSKKASVKKSEEKPAKKEPKAKKVESTDATSTVAKKPTAKKTKKADAAE